MPLPPALQGGNYNPGTFVQLSTYSQGVRGITFDNNGQLWVAYESGNMVGAYNKQGYSVKNISISSPIGMFFDQKTNYLYIGSKSGNVVKRYNTATSQWSGTTYSTSSLNHPAGLAVDSPNQILYVASQDDSSVLKFNAASGSFLGTVISSLPDKPEDILLSNC